MQTLPAPATMSTRTSECWRLAIDRLDPDTKASLAAITTRKLDILQTVIRSAEDRRKDCISRQWKLKTPGGKVVILRDVVEKISGWLDRFKAIGDTIIQYDPAHAALPWAAFRFLLNVAVGDVQVWGGMLINLETISRVLFRCRMIEDIYLTRPQNALKRLEDALSQLYSEILIVLGTLVKYFKGSTAGRIISSAIRPDHSLQNMTAVESLEKEVLKLAALGDSELLQATNSATTMITQKVTAMSKVLEGNLTRLIDANMIMSKSLDEKKLSNVLTWLSTVPYALHQKYIAAARIPGSGAWFLKSSDFSTWLASSSSGIFLLHGVRGCGKSTIASLVVDHFQRPSSQPGVIPVSCAYYFCDNSVSETNCANPESIFRSVVRQLAIDSSSGSIDQAVLAIYEKNLKEADQGKVQIAQLRLEDSLSLLLDLTMCNPAYILIDAVDQLDDDSRATLIHALRRLVANSASIVKVFLTSCDNAHVEGLLEDATKLRVAASHNGEDVRAFATAKLKEADMKRRILNGAASSTLLNKMARSLIKGAGEMFLWVSLQLDFLCRKKTEGDILLALENGLAVDLDQIYGRTLDNLLLLDPTAKGAVLHIFSCLLYAKRPLHPSALLGTLALNPVLAGHDTSQFNIQDLCCSLVLADATQGAARFCHQSVRDYMRKQEIFSESACNELLATICLRQCSYGPSESVFVGDKSPIQEFYHYAAIHWPEHLRECEYRDSVSNALQKTMSHFIVEPGEEYVSPSFVTWLGWIDQTCHGLPHYHDIKSNFEPVLSNDASPVFVLCVFGLCRLLKYVMEVLPSVDLNATSATGHTGIYLASSYGHGDVVIFLLGQNADPDLECGTFGTPIRVACFRGHLNVVQALIQRTTRVCSLDPFSSAYKAACIGGHEQVAMYLAKKVSISRSAGHHTSMVDDAIEAGFPKLVEWLTKPTTLKAWGLPAPSDDSGARMVSSAIITGHTSVLDSLLKKRPSLKQALPKDCIAMAALAGHSKMTEYLVALGAKPTEEGPFGSPLRCASLKGHATLVRELISLRVDVTICGAEGDALQAASMNGYVHVMELLIQAGADVNQQGKPRGTCLQAAAWYGHQEAVELLLSHGADMYQKGHSMDSLHAAIDGGHEEIASILLSKGYRLPKGVSLPAVARGEEGDSMFMKRIGSSQRESGLQTSNQDTDKDEDEDSGTGQSADDVSLVHSDAEDMYQQSLSDEVDSNSNLSRGIELSAATGDMPVLHYHLLRNGVTGQAVLNAIGAAASRGRLEVLGFLIHDGASKRWLNTAEEDFTPAMRSAAGNGHCSALQLLGNTSGWKLKENETAWGDTLKAAVMSGSMACAVTLLEHHPAPSEDFLVEFSEVIDSSLGLSQHHLTRLLWAWLFLSAGIQYEHGNTNNHPDSTIPIASAEMASFLAVHLNHQAEGPEEYDDFDGILPTLILTATKGRDIGVLKLLLAKANAEGYVDALAKPFLSVCTGDLTDLELLINSVEGTFAITDDQLCLGIYFAALAGKSKVVRFLVQQMKGIPKSNRALLYESFLAASDRGHTSVLRAMLQMNDFWKGIGESNKKVIITRGLVAAIESGHQKAVQLLLDNDADIHSCVPSVPDPREYSADCGWDVADQNPVTPKIGASHFDPWRRIPKAQDRPETISALQAALRGFENVASIEHIVENTQCYWEHGVHKPMAKLSRALESLVTALLDLGCDPSDKGGQPDYPIQYAARWSNDRVVQALLDAGADAETEATDNSNQPVMLAAARGYRFAYSIVARLVKAGASIPLTSKGSLPRTILNAFEYPLVSPNSTGIGASRDEHESNALPLEMARKFMSSGMRALLIHVFKQLPQQPVNRRELRSFLTAAATAGDRVCVKLLLKHKIRVNSTRDGHDTALGCAAENGHIQIMKDLLDAGADVDCREFRYRPQDAMVKAIIGGHTSAVKLLARHGADLTRVEAPSFLMLAVRSRSLEMVACLLELGLLPESDPDTLVAACRVGEVELVSSLLSAGATVKQRVGCGSHCLPLYKAAQGGHLDIVNLLLEHGADPNLGTGYDLGMPLVIAASKGHLDIVKTLLVHGANPDLTRDTVLRCSQDETEEFLSESDECYIGEPSHRLISPTALDEACRNSHFRIVEELLSHKATITDCLANICHGNWSSTKANILELLIEAISAKDNFEIVWKRAASQATAPNNRHLIEMLLDYVPTSTHLLVLASGCGSVSAVLRCLAQGIALNSPDEHGFVPLSSAARGLHKEVVRLLVSEGANVNQVDVEGQTALLAALTGFRASLEEPLHETTHANTTDIQDTVRCLVNGGAQLMVGDPKACETLELACSTGHTEIVAQLLTIRKVGDWAPELQTWLFAAIDGNYPDIVSTLLKEGADPYKTRLLHLRDDRARLLVTHDNASDMQGMTSQEPFEAALGRGNSCLLRVFLDSLPGFRVSNETLIRAAQVYVAKSYLGCPQSARSSDLATILNFDLSLVVPKDVLRILADGHADELLGLVIPRSECTDSRRFTNRSMTARAPPLLSQAPDMLRRRLLSQMPGMLRQRR